MIRETIRGVVKQFTDEALIEMWQNINFLERNGALPQGPEIYCPLAHGYKAAAAALSEVAPDVSAETVSVALISEVWREVAVRKILPDWVEAMANLGVDDL